MVRLGIHSYLFTEHWSDDTLDILDTACRLGAGMMEIGVGNDVHFTPRLTRRRAESLGMELSLGPGGRWPLDCDLSSDDPADRSRGLAWHQRNVDLAAEVGAMAYCGALYGHPGVVKRRLPPPEEYPRIAEGMKRLAEYGQRRGVTIVIEPMSHFRTHLVNTPKQAMRLARLVGDANLRVLLDTYHLVTEIRDYRKAVLTVGDRLWGIHACENDRGVLGDGLIPWEDLFSALQEIDFAGIVMLETYNSSIGDFALRRGMFHDVCPDPEAFVRQGFAFLLRQLEVSG